MPIGCSCGRSVVTVALTGWRRILFFPVLGSTTVARLVWITMGSGMLSELGEDGGGGGGGGGDAFVYTWVWKIVDDSINPHLSPSCRPEARLRPSNRTPTRHEDSPRGEPPLARQDGYAGAAYDAPQGDGALRGTRKGIQQPGRPRQSPRQGVCAPSPTPTGGHSADGERGVGVRAHHGGQPLRSGPQSVQGVAREAPRTASGRPACTWSRSGSPTTWRR